MPSAVQPETPIEFLSLSVGDLPAPSPDSPVLAVQEELDSYPRESGIPELLGSHRYCSFARPVDMLGEDSVVTRIWVPCDRWVCRWCRDQKIESESRRFAAGFATDGRQVYLTYFQTREQATNAMRYATKLGHSALAIPQYQGCTVLVTTQPRKQSRPLNGQAEVAETIEAFLTNVPAYTKDGGEHRVINPNKVLAAALLSAADFRAQEVHDRRAEYMAADELAALEYREANRRHFRPTEMLDRALDRLGLILSKSQYGHIMSYRIPDTQTEPLISMLFWEEFGKLHEIADQVRAAA